ncbi:uncharacterized protein TrAFT101_011999 [Trichoderma asperellum]|uniref:uncharacterized protein n=1 Tax=Trichoderma asperellum TaxID=101201 RepID=UPI003331A7E9|nr:hypothetical protein TrAFT101_011999 [Trichoderma asperellum]
MGVRPYIRRPHDLPKGKLHRHKISPVQCVGAQNIPPIVQENRSSQPFGRYGKPNFSHGRCTPRSHGKTRHRGWHAALQATHVTLPRPPGFQASHEQITTAAVVTALEMQLVGLSFELFRHMIDWHFTKAALCDDI